MTDTGGASELYDDLFDVGWHSETTGNTTQDTADTTRTDEGANQAGTDEAESADTGHHGDDEATCDDLDLYDDILTEEDCRDKQSYDEMVKKFEAAMATISKLRNENESLQSSVKKFQTTSENAQKNISSILLTARAEVNRKTQEINNLRKQLTKPSLGSHRRFARGNSSFSASEQDSPSRRPDLEKSGRGEKGSVTTRVSAENILGSLRRGLGSDSETTGREAEKSSQSKIYKQNCDKDTKQKPERERSFKEARSEYDKRTSPIRKSNEISTKSYDHKEQRRNSKDKEVVKSREQKDTTEKRRHEVSERSSRSQSSRLKTNSSLKDMAKERSQSREKDSGKRRDKSKPDSVVKECVSVRNIERLVSEEKEHCINRHIDKLETSEYRSTRKEKKTHSQDREISHVDNNKHNSRTVVVSTSMSSKCSEKESARKKQDTSHKTDAVKRKPEGRNKETEEETPKIRLVANKPKVFDLRNKLKSKKINTEAIKPKEILIEKDLVLGDKIPDDRKKDECVRDITTSNNHVAKVSPRRKQPPKIDLEGDKQFLSQLLKSAKSDNKSTEFNPKTQIKDINCEGAKVVITKSNCSKDTDRSITDYSDVDIDCSKQAIVSINTDLFYNKSNENNRITTEASKEIPEKTLAIDTDMPPSTAVVPSNDVKLSDSEAMYESGKADIVREKAETDAIVKEEKMTYHEDNIGTNSTNRAVADYTDANSSCHSQNKVVDRETLLDQSSMNEQSYVVSKTTLNLVEAEKKSGATVDDKIGSDTANSDHTDLGKSTSKRVQEKSEIGSDTPTTPESLKKLLTSHDPEISVKGLNNDTFNGDMPTNNTQEGDGVSQRCNKEGNIDSQENTSRRKSSDKVQNQQPYRGVISETISSVTMSKQLHVETDLNSTSLSTPNKLEGEKVSPNRFCGKLNCKMKVNHLHPKVGKYTSPLKGKNLSTSPNQDIIENKSNESIMSKEVAIEKETTDHINTTIESVASKVILSPITIVSAETEKAVDQKENLAPADVSMNSGSSGSFGSNILSERTKSPETLDSSASSTDSSDSDYTDSEYETANSYEPRDETDKEEVTGNSAGSEEESDVNSSSKTVEIDIMSKKGGSNVKTNIPESDLKRDDDKKVSNSHHAELKPHKIQPRNDANTAEQAQGEPNTVTKDDLILTLSLQKQKECVLPEVDRCDKGELIVDNLCNGIESLKDQTLKAVHKTESKVISNIDNKDEIDKAIVKRSPNKRKSGANSVHSVLTQSPDKSFLLQSLLCGVESLVEAKQCRSGENAQTDAPKSPGKSGLKIDDNVQQNKENQSSGKGQHERELLETDLFGAPLSSDSSDNSSSDSETDDSESGSTSSSHSCSCASCDCGGSSASSSSSSYSSSDSETGDSDEPQTPHKTACENTQVDIKKESDIVLSKSAGNAITNAKQIDTHEIGSRKDNEPESVVKTCSPKESSNNPEFSAKQISPCVLKISRQQKNHQDDAIQIDDTNNENVKQTKTQAEVLQTDKHDCMSTVHHKSPIKETHCDSTQKLADEMALEKEKENIPDHKKEKDVATSVEIVSDKVENFKNIIPVKIKKDTEESNNQQKIETSNQTLPSKSDSVDKGALNKRKDSEEENPKLMSKITSKLSSPGPKYIGGKTGGKLSDESNTNIPNKKKKDCSTKDQSHVEKSFEKALETASEQPKQLKKKHGSSSLPKEDVAKSISRKSTSQHHIKTDERKVLQEKSKSTDLSHSASTLKHVGKAFKNPIYKDTAATVMFSVDKKNQSDSPNASCSDTKKNQSNRKGVCLEKIGKPLKKKPNLDNKEVSTKAVGVVSTKTKLSPERALQEVTSFNLESYKIPKRTPVCVQHSSRSKPSESKNSVSVKSRERLNEKKHDDKIHIPRREASKSSRVSSDASEEKRTSRTSTSHSEKYNTHVKSKPALSKEFVSSESDTSASLISSDSDNTDNESDRLVEAIFGKSGSSAESQKFMNYTDQLGTKNNTSIDDIVKNLVKENERLEKVIGTRKRVRKISSDTESENGINKKQINNKEISKKDKPSGLTTGKPDLISPRTQTVHHASRLVSELIQRKSNKRKDNISRSNEVEREKSKTDKDGISRTEKHVSDKRHGESKTGPGHSGSVSKHSALKVSTEISGQDCAADIKSDNSKDIRKQSDLPANSRKKSDLPINGHESKKAEIDIKAPNNVIKKSKTVYERSVIENEATKAEHLHLKSEKHLVKSQNYDKKEKSVVLTLDVHDEETLDLDYNEDMCFEGNNSESDSECGSESGSKSSSSCSSSEDGEISEDSDTEQIQFKRSPTKPFKLFQENPASPNKMTVNHAFNTRLKVDLKFSPIKFPPSPPADKKASKWLDMDAPDQDSPRRGGQVDFKRKYVSSDSASDTDRREVRSKHKSTRKFNSPNRRKKSVSTERRPSNSRRSKSRSPNGSTRKRSRSYSPRQRGRSRSVSPRNRSERFGRRNSRYSKEDRQRSPRRQRSSSRDNDKNKQRSTQKLSVNKDKVLSNDYNSDSPSERRDGCRRRSRQAARSRHRSPHSDKESSDRTGKETQSRLRENIYRERGSGKKMIKSDKKKTGEYTDRRRQGRGEESEPDIRKSEKMADKEETERLKSSKETQTQREAHSKTVKRDHRASDNEQLDSKAKGKKRKHFRSSTDYETDSDQSLAERGSTPIVKKVRKDVK